MKTNWTPATPTAIAPAPARHHSIPRLFASLVAGLLPLLNVPAAHAGLPEPDTVFYGAIALNNVFATASDTNVTVEVRKSPGGPAVASYRMGQKESVGDRYAIRAKVESSAPLSDPAATPVGGTVFLSVLQSGVVRTQASFVLTGRGEFVNFNFGAADTDGDGMSDEFELLHFRTPTAGNPNADPDNDGRTNRQEFQMGTNPWVPDTFHPADVAPANWTLSASEVDAYALAWNLGEDWPDAPTNIPINYVTRAGALLAGGGTYRITNTIAAPNWWLNSPLPAPTNGVASLSITRQLPPTYDVLTPFQVNLVVSAGPGTRSHAIEETPPPGWLVRFVSNGGHYNSSKGTIRWGPYSNAGQRTLSYELTPLSSAGVALFSGIGSFDGTNVVAGGTATIAPPGLAAAQLSRAGFTLTNSTFAFDVTGLANTTYVIETSTNLVFWNSGTTITLDSSGSGRLTFPVGTTNRTLYYRVRLAP